MSQKIHFSLLATTFAGGPKPRTTALIVFGLWFVLFFAALFAPPLLDDADASHSQAARAMVTTGDLVTLKIDGVRYLEKAPLPYWLVALSFRIFGFNTFAVHLPQALSVLLLALLGHRWANQAFGSRTGFYTALTLLTSVGIFLFTRVFIPDILLSLLLGISLFAFLKCLNPQFAVERAPSAFPVDGTEIQEKPGVIWYANPLFYAAVLWSSLALAVLTKGLVALVFFFGTSFAYLLLTGELHRWRDLRPFSGTLLFLAIAAPWHILAGLRNTGGMNGHGFFWFYFINEHVLRFLGRRIPRDYNKLPGYLFWLQHLVWLFPWSLFFPLAVAAVARHYWHQARTLTGHLDGTGTLDWMVLVLSLPVLVALQATLHFGTFEFVILAIAVIVPVEVFRRRRRAGLSGSPFHRIDPQQRSILLLSLFAGIILIFFSLSTNQEYYTLPAYLPVLLLLAATISRAEQTFSSSPSSRRWINFAHAALTVLGLAIAAALIYGLWMSRNEPFIADIGDLLAHRGVGDYTLSTSHVFDLTARSFAALRLPAALAALAFLLGPALAWLLRAQRRHLAATSTIAFTSAAFLIAAHIAFVRFAPMMSSEVFAARIQALEQSGQASANSQVMLFGDQAYGSSIPFYFGHPVELVDARSTSMLFGSTFPDVPPVFVSSEQMVADWGSGPRKLLFVPLEKRDDVDRLLGNRQIILQELSGKALITDRPLKPKTPNEPISLNLPPRKTSS